MHTCPASGPAADDGDAKPHLGGVFIGPCAGTVIIEGARAARLADFAFCVGAGVVDLAAQGAATVLIEQLPALRLTDRTLHGGAVSAGATRTHIGGPTFEVPPNVSIAGPSDFQNRVIRDLFLISTTPDGKAWLARLAATGKPVLIVDRDGTGMNGAESMPGGGSVIFYDSMTTITYEAGPGKPMPGEPQSALAHEIIHATRMAEGDHDVTQGDRHEPNATKLEDEEKLVTTQESEIRKQWGLPPRERHPQDSVPVWRGEPSPLVRPGRY